MRLLAWLLLPGAAATDCPGAALSVLSCCDPYFEVNGVGTWQQCSAGNPPTPTDVPEGVPCELMVAGQRCQLLLCESQATWAPALPQAGCTTCPICKANACLMRDLNPDQSLINANPAVSGSPGCSIPTWWSNQVLWSGDYPHPDVVESGGSCNFNSPGMQCTQITCVNGAWDDPTPACSTGGTTAECRYDDLMNALSANLDPSITVAGSSAGCTSGGMLPSDDGCDVLLTGSNCDASICFLQQQGGTQPVWVPPPPPSPGQTAPGSLQCYVGGCSLRRLRFGPLLVSLEPQVQGTHTGCTRPDFAPPVGYDDDLWHPMAVPSGTTCTFTAAGPYSCPDVTCNSGTWTPQGVVDCTMLMPSAGPTILPTVGPASPTASPRRGGVAYPSVSPERLPSYAPLADPTWEPSTAPTLAPSGSPTTPPTASPSTGPSTAPTSSPSAPPTASPTALPTQSPTSSPSASPSAGPSAAPLPPSLSPSAAPSRSPARPTRAPSATPSAGPTAGPLTPAPTLSPSVPPSKHPSAGPSQPPSATPSAGPTAAPSRAPSTVPTAAPSTSPLRPSVSPTQAPLAPSASPSQTPLPDVNVSVEWMTVNGKALREAPQLVAVLRITGPASFRPDARVEVVVDAARKAATNAQAAVLLYTDVHATQYDWAGVYQGVAAYSAAGGPMELKVVDGGSAAELRFGGPQYRLRSPIVENLAATVTDTAFAGPLDYRAVCQNGRFQCENVTLGAVSGEKPRELATKAAVQQGETVAVAATSASAAAAAAVGGGASAAGLARLSMVSGSMGCPANGSEPEELDVSLNPLGFSFGYAQHPARFAQGAVVGNTVLLCAAVTCCAVGLVVAHLRWRRRVRISKERGLPVPRHSLRSMAIRARLGWLLIPMSFLYGGIAVGGVISLTDGDPGFVVLAVLSLLLYSGLMLYYVYRAALKAPTMATYEVLEGPDRPTGISYILWGASGWVPNPDAHKKTFKFLELHHLVFDGYKNGFRRFTMTLELLYTLVLAAVAVWSPPTLDACQVQAGLLAAIPILWSVYIALFQPYIAPYENFMEAMIALAEGVMMAVAASGTFAGPASWHDDFSGNLALLVVYSIMLKTMLDLGIFVYDAYQLYKEHGGEDGCGGFLRWFFLFQGKITQHCETQCWSCRNAMGEEDLASSSSDEDALKGVDPATRRFMKEAEVEELPQMGSHVLLGSDSDSDNADITENRFRRSDGSGYTSPEVETAALDYPCRTPTGFAGPVRQLSSLPALSGALAPQEEETAGAAPSSPAGGRGRGYAPRRTLQPLQRPRHRSTISQRTGRPPSRRRSSTSVGRGDPLRHAPPVRRSSADTSGTANESFRTL